MVSFMTLQNSMDERKLKNYQAFDQGKARQVYLYSTFHTQW